RRRWRLVEEPRFRQIIEPGLLPFRVLDSVRDLIFELAVLVENQSASAENPDAALRINPLRRNDPELPLELVSLKLQDLNVFGHGLVQHKAIGTNANRGTNRLHFDIAILVDLERFPVFPDETKHLFRVAQHRIVVISAIDQLYIASLPRPVDIRLAGLL